MTSIPPVGVHQSTLRPPAAPELSRRAILSRVAGNCTVGDGAPAAVAMLGRRPARRLVCLANEQAAVAGQVSLEAIANEYAPDEDGWMLLAPLGEHVNHRVVLANGIERDEYFLQVIDQGVATALANEVNSLLSKLRRFRRSVPIYERHPDQKRLAPNVAAEAGAEIEMGGVYQARVTERGLETRQVLSGPGADAVEKRGLKYFSPFWWTTTTGETRTVKHGGRDITAVVVKPTRFISVGLTDRPQLAGGDPLANQKPETSNEKLTMKKSLLAMLASIGVPLANDVADSALEAELPKLEAKLKEITPLANELPGVKTKLTEAETALANEKAARKTAEEALANERKEVDGIRVDLAIAEGRIAPSERATWSKKFETDRAAATTALANEAIKFHTLGTKAHTAGTESRKPDANSYNKLLALANEIVKAGDAKDLATGMALARQRNPELAQAAEAQLKPAA